VGTYLKVIREKCSEALHILDRFHIVAKMNKALDEVRAGESRRMTSEGRTPLLKEVALAPAQTRRESDRTALPPAREGLNNKAKVTMRKSYGCRTFRVLELTLYHSLGKLPESGSTHDFF
jgi:transposase